MDITLLIAKVVLTVILLPIFGALYLDNGKNLANTIPKWKKYTVSNNHFWTSIISLLVLIGLETYSYHKSKPTLVEKKLEFISVDVYKDEISNKLEALKDSLDIEQSKKQLLLKFEHAAYAWKSGDDEEVVKTLNELYSGKDHIGSLPQIKSFVVLNNLGVAYFDKQRNSEFMASKFFQEALRVIEINSPHKERILNNYRNLDNMVNNLD